MWAGENQPGRGAECFTEWGSRQEDAIITTWFPVVCVKSVPLVTTLLNGGRRRCVGIQSSVLTGMETIIVKHTATMVMCREACSMLMKSVVIKLDTYH